MILEAKQISKNYGGKPVLKNIDFKLAKGQAISLVGPNGCGKSTLLRILAGLTRPSGGTVETSEHASCGYIPDHYEKINMTIRKYMQYITGIEGNPAIQDTLEHYYSDFRLVNFLDTPMKYLSKGSLQKAAAIQALLTRKDILFMDEPLSGQDTLSQMNFVREMKKRKEAGMAIVMSCHDSYLTGELSDRIYLIQDGIITDGTDYVYGSKTTKCVFLVRSHKPLADLSLLMRQKTGDASLKIGDYGSLWKIDAAPGSAAALFQLFLAEELHIVRYEEVEELC